jgi:hypothetical protein
LFEVITDDAAYPRFNPAVVEMTVVAKDQSGAEFVAKRKTRIAKQVRAFDRHERQRNLTIKRTYGPKSKAQSPWTIHRVDAPPLHAHDRCLDHHAAPARLGDEATPAAALLRHQFQSVHPGGAATHKPDKKPGG